MKVSNPIFTTIVKIISDISGSEVSELHPDSHIYDDINMEPEEISSMITEISEHFKLELLPEDVESIDTISDIENLIKDKTDEL